MGTNRGTLIKPILSGRQANRGKNHMGTLTKDMVTFTITPETEDFDIRKELSFEATGVDHSEYINKVLKDNGQNIWLWCEVVVKAEWNGITSTAYLGQCAYENEADFIACGYYGQMQNEAFQEILDVFNAVAKVISEQPKAN